MSKKPLPRAFVKPSPGCLVRKGLGQPFLKEEGEEVELTIYWLRRIRMKDVVRCSAVTVLGEDASAEAPKSQDPKKSKGKDKS